jgi:GNAT superfamily N-acetyltransferase
VKAEEILTLRHRVLRAGLPQTAAKFPGDDDPQTVHLAIRDGTNIVGCATILVNQWKETPACQLRGMAVDPAYQGRGLGTRLLAAIDQTVRDKGFHLLWANARVPAAEFYRNNGWEIVSEIFEIPTAGPHFKMIRKLG